MSLDPVVISHEMADSIAAQTAINYVPVQINDTSRMAMFLTSIKIRWFGNKFFCISGLQAYTVHIFE